MKKTLLFSGVMAAMMLASCTTNESQATETTDVVTDSLQITDPELWAA